MWAVIYHAEVENDLKSLGNSAAKRVLKAIDERIRHGEPDKLGKPLSSDLSGCRRIRIGDTRIIYKVYKNEIKVLVIAVGPRKDDAVYKSAYNRV